MGADGFLSGRTVRTQVIKIDPRNVEPGIIQNVVATLSRGGVIVYPTDTFYGLGADSYTEKAVERISSLKKRRRLKPFPVLISGPEMLEDIVEDVPPSFSPISSRFWPGPLTLVLKAASGFPAGLLGPGRSIGVRLPAVPWLRELVGRLGSPMVATSANITGRGELSRPEEIIQLFDGKVELIVDGGKTPGVRPSTVIDLTSGKPKLLRHGAISMEELQEYLH